MLNKYLKMYRIYSFLILLSFIAVSLHVKAAPTNNEEDEILFISSYNVESQYVHSNVSAFVDAYIQQKGHCTPIIEDLSCNTITESHLWVPLIKSLVDKHPKAKLIILMGPEAWISYFSLQDEKYKKIPLFCIMAPRYLASSSTPEIPSIYRDDINHSRIRIDALEIMQDFNVQLCYYYNYGIAEDIQLIRNFYPQTQNIAIISDNTYSGICLLRTAKLHIQQYEPRWNLIHIDGRFQTMDEALTIASNLPANTAGILCNWRYDTTGASYMNNASYAFQKANPELPVFSVSGTAIGYWAIGGNVPQYRPLGIELAEKAIQLMETPEKWGGPYIESYNNETKLDMEILREKNLLSQKIPSDAVYVNTIMSWEDIYTMYKGYFIMGLILFIFLIAGFIIFLSYSLRIRHLKNKVERSERQLKKEKDELIESEKQLRIAKEEAEEANRMKSTFVSNMSHEIRTPLNAIVGFSEVLVSETKDNEGLREFAGIIKNNSDLLLKLVNDILDLSRLEANKQVFNFEPYDLIPYCSSIIATLKDKVQQGVEMRFSSPVKELIVITDVIRLQQVIINLIGNACKFTHKGFIELSVTPNKEKQVIVFKVTDTGIGIPLKERKHIFDRFKKLNENIQGTGLGLSICQITVQKLGGEIWIDNDYAEGTQFVFTLPMNHSTGETIE